MTETNPTDPMETLAVWLRANGYAPLLDCAVADCDTKALYAAIERYGRAGNYDAAVGAQVPEQPNGEARLDALTELALTVAEAWKARNDGGVL